MFIIMVFELRIHTLFFSSHHAVCKETFKHSPVLSGPCSAGVLFRICWNSPSQCPLSLLLSGISGISAVLGLWTGTKHYALNCSFILCFDIYNHLLGHKINQMWIIWYNPCPNNIIIAPNAIQTVGARFNIVRILLLAYSGCHLLLLHLYQFQFFQEAVAPDSLPAR